MKNHLQQKYFQNLLYSRHHYRHGLGGGGIIHIRLSADSPEAHKTDTGSNMRWTWKMAIMETESVIGLREEKNVNFGWRDMESLLGR